MMHLRTTATHLESEKNPRNRAPSMRSTGITTLSADLFTRSNAIPEP
jgi:hypothetical protein